MQFEDLIQEVLLTIEGAVADQDLYGTLHADITATASTFTVDGGVFPDGSGFTTGLIEVGDELVYTQTFDKSTGAFAGALRGWRGTAAVSHAAGTLIRNNPRFPRIAVKRAINDTIQSIYPAAAAIRTYEFTYKGAQVRYDMPADCRNVIQVQYYLPGASKSWVPSKRWNFDLTGGSTSVTGRALDVWDAIPGRKVQVVYYADPAPLSAVTDVYATVSGLPDWTKDLVIFGACYRLFASLDAGRVGINTAEQAAMSASAYYGAAEMTSGQNLSKYYYQLYLKKLTEVQDRFQTLYPVSRHYIV